MILLVGGFFFGLVSGIFLQRTRMEKHYMKQMEDIKRYYKNRGIK